MAEKVLAGQGWAAWPACSRKAGARGAATPRVVQARTPQPATGPKHAATPVPAASPAVPPAAARPVAAQPIYVVPRTTDQAAPKPAAPRTYQVRPGDSLSSIAAAQGVPGGWRALYDGNRSSVGNANLIRPGQQLTLG